MTRTSLFAASFCVALAAHGCAATPGRPVTLELALALTGADATSSLGWSIHVDEAAVLVGAVRLRDATMPALARLEALVTPRALAHGGHGEGDATVLVAWAGAEVVTLAEERAMLLLDGRAGTTDRLALVLGGAPSAGDPRASALHGLELFVAGTATQGAETVRFAGGLDLPEAEAERLVEGVPVAGLVDDGALVRIALDLSACLDAVHFDRLVPEGGVAPITDGSQAALALRLGAGAPGSYAATLADP